MVLIGKNGRYSLSDKPFKQGGEGFIYSLQGRTDLVAKLYRQERITSELAEKLSFMANNPPDSSILDQIAWPKDVLRDNNGDFVGFVMPKLEIDTDLKAVYTYPPKEDLQISYEQKVIIAINICIVISEIHKAGYTFGDFNPLNIGVNLTTGHVAFLDTDSYHIYDKYNRKLYKCGVCLDGYVAPELIKQCRGYDYLSAPLPTFTQETDKFALAIHIFKLLMNGFTPFNGIDETVSVSQTAPIGNKAIENDCYCFKPGNKPQSEATPALSSLSIPIQYLFHRAFIDGRNNPEVRPSADEWKDALLNYKNNLIKCNKNQLHFYYANNTSCPYCEADKRYLTGLKQCGSNSQISFAQPISVPGSVNRPLVSPSGGTRTTSYTGSQILPPTTPPPKVGSFKKIVVTGLIIAAVLLGLILLISKCSSASKGTNNSNYGNNNKNNSTSFNTDYQITGVWYGDDGSVFTLYDNGKVNYSYYGSEDTFAYGTWSVKEDNPSRLNVTCEYNNQTTLIYADMGSNKTPFSLYFVPADSSQLWNAETFTRTVPDNVLYDGSTVERAKKIAPNESVFGRIYNTNDENWFELKLEKAGIVTFEFSHEQIDSGDYYWVVYVYDKEMNEIYSYSITGKDRKTILPILGLSAGVYKVKVTDAYKLTYGRHSNIEYTLIPGYSQTELCEREYNDVASKSGPLQLNESVVGSILNTNGIDWYDMVLESPGTVTFEFSHDQIDSDYYYWNISVYDTSNYDGYDGDLVQIYSYSLKGKDRKTTLPVLGLSAGAYKVKVTDAYKLTYGQHSNKQYAVLPKYEKTDYCEREDNSKSKQAGPLFLNHKTIGSILDTNGVDWFDLSLESAGSITIEFSHKQIDSVDYYWIVTVYDTSNYDGYDGDLKEVYSKNISGKDKTTTFTISGLAKGSYKVKVTDAYKLTYGRHSDTEYTITVRK